MATMQLELKDNLQNGTNATLNNHTVANMQILRSHSWSGRFTSPPTSITSHGGVARINHVKGNQGSKAGVSYTIPSATGTPFAVILAWDAPSNFNPTTSPNKVFAIYGPKKEVDSLTWSSIETHFSSASSSVTINDPISKISIHSTIINSPKTNMANLLANFLQSP